MEWNLNVELSSACGCALSAQPNALDSSTFGFHSIENSDTSCFTNCSSNLCVIPKEAIERCGVEVKAIQPVEGLPDMVFCCNAGIVHGKKVYTAKFRHAERSGEEKHYKRWFDKNGYQIFESEENFEGGGDAVISRADNKLFAGYGFRSAKEAYEGVKKLGEYQTILCELINPRFYHMDTCLALLNSKCALWYPDAFSEESRGLIRSEISHLIPVPEEEANNFICNSISFGNTVITPPGCPVTKKEMETFGFRVVEVDMSEFMKAGGACQCLVLKL